MYNSVYEDRLSVLVGKCKLALTTGLDAEPRCTAQMLCGYKSTDTSNIPGKAGAATPILSSVYNQSDCRHYVFQYRLRQLLRLREHGRVVVRMIDISACAICCLYICRK